MTKKKKYIIILLLLLCGSALFFLIKQPKLPKNPLITDDSADNWDGNKELYNPQDKVPMIEIPGISSLAFKPNETKQEVNFFNPEKNNCLFCMTLFVDNKQYWQSGYVAPGKGFYNIELTEPITAGIYDNAYLLVECFKEDGTVLNGAAVDFQLFVK